jgi:hypothetical protein
MTADELGRSVAFPFSCDAAPPPTVEIADFRLPIADGIQSQIEKQKFFVTTSVIASAVCQSPTKILEIAVARLAMTDRLGVILRLFQNSRVFPAG